MQMTIKQLNKLKHGTRVAWAKDNATGYVVHLPDSHPRAGDIPDPAVYVQWDDGQRTHGLDDGALQHVTLAAGVSK